MSVVIEQFLRDVMAQYDAGAGTIKLGDNINQSVADLLGYAQTTSVRLTGATVTSTASQVVIQGVGPMPKLGGTQTITLTGTDNAGVLGLVLTAAPGADITDLSTIFPGLKGSATAQEDGIIITAPSLFYSLTYLAPQWLITNITPPDGVIYPGLGLNLKADVPLKAAFPQVVTLTGLSQVTFKGPVSFPVGEDTQLYLDAEFPGFSMAVGTMSMSQFHLVIRTVYYSDAEDQDQDSTGNLFTGVLDLGNGVQARIGVDTRVVPPNNPNSSIWSFYTNFEKPLTLDQGISALTGFLGIGGSFDLPPSLPLLGSVGLSQLVVGVNPYDFTDISFVFIEVATTEKWAPIPWVTVEEVHCQWQILGPFKADSTQSGGVGGTLAIGKDKPVHLGLSALIPDYVITANLREGDTISVVEVISNFFPDAGGLGQDLVIDDLGVVANIDNNTYELSGSVKPVPPFSLDLIITTLVLERVSANINYSPNQLYGTILANLNLFDAEWQVAANYLRPAESDSGTWSFLIQMDAGSSVDLTKLVARFLDFSPASLPQVSLDELYFYYDLGTKTYRFRGAVKGTWGLPLIPGSPDLTVKAAVEVESSHPDGDEEVTEYSGSIGGSLDISRFLVAVGYAFDPTNTTLTFVASYKEIALYGTWMQTKAKDGTTKSILKFNFGDLSLGDIITYLVNLANPNADFSLDAPWDILNSLNLKNLTLKVDLNDYSVGIEYNLDGLNLVFLSLDSVSLTLKKKDDGKRTVIMGLTGSFLGQSFGGDNDELNWDLLDDPPPAVPGKGTKVFDLQFLAIGQHVEIKGYQAFDTVEDAIKGMIAAMKPASGNTNPLSGSTSLAFNKDSNLLFGVQFVVLDGIAISAVLNDPNLYGLLIELSGEVAKSLAGLKFELLYKRITDTLGVFKVVFRVPAIFRQLEFGAVSVTLPTIKVDIYTNGNFKIDLGFPTDEAFSDSFGLQVFPFIGKGGFYFGYLVGAASKTVPVVTNGQFSPVIELGLALAVGIGKEISKGPLSAGLSLTVQAILEGTLAWFHPYDTSLPVDTYYRVLGTAAIVGKLYGAVDFKIIKVSVAVVARASVTLVIECYMPIKVDLVVEVSVEASIKILFIRIHFSFDMSLNLSFQIGSASATPWIIGASSGSGASLPNPTLARRAPGAARGRPRAIPASSRLRLYTPLNRLPAVARPGAPRRMTAIRPRLRAEDGNFAALRGAMAPHLMVTATPRATFDWDAVQVFPAQKTLPVLVMPALSVADSATLLPADRGPGATTTILPLTLVVENGIHAEASTLAQLRTVTAETAHSTSDPAQLPFNLLADGMLAWSITSFLTEGAAALGGSITRYELELLVDALNKAQTDGDAFTSAQLKAFFDLNYLFQLGCHTGDSSAVNPSGATFIPIPPVVSLSVPGKPQIDFSNYRMVGDRYEDVVASYFSEMTVDYGSDNAAHPHQLQSVTPAAGEESVAAMIQRDYFLLVARAVAQKGLDLMAAMPVPVGAGTKLSSLLADYPRGTANHVIHQGETVSSLESTYFTTLDQLKRLNPTIDFSQPLAAGEIVVVPEGPTATAIVTANASRTDIFVDKAPVPISGAVIQAGGTDSLSGVAGTFGVALADLVALNAASTSLLASGAALALPSFPYASVSGDSLDFIAAFLLVRNGEVPANQAQDWYGLPNLNWYSQAISNLNSDKVDFGKPLPAGTPISIPAAYNNPVAGSRYLSRAGDTLERIAGTYLLVQAPTAGMVAFRDSLAIGISPRPDPDAILPTGTVVTVPAWSHVIQTKDSLADIMALLGISPATLITSASMGDAALLAKLAAIALPDFNYALAATQSFNALAELFDLSLDALAAALLDASGYLSGVLTIPDLYQVPVATLRSQVTGQVNEIASSSSRYMMHGLRLPAVPASALDPVDTSTLYGLYEIVGQQVTLDGLSLPATLTLASDDANLVFNQTYVVQAGDSWAGLVAQYPDFASYNPGLTAADIKPGLLVFITRESQLEITIDQAFIDAHSASSDLDMQWLDSKAPLSALPLSDANPAQYSLADLAGWQTPVPPPYGGHPAGTIAGAGTPSLWSFSSAILGQIGAGAGTRAAYRLMQGVLDPHGKMVSSELGYYSWATLIDLSVQQVPQEPPGLATESSPAPGPATPAASGLMPNTYLVLAGSDESQRLLHDLWSYLQANTGQDAPLLRVLYPAAAQSDNAEGWVSLTEDPGLTYVVKTNLSTLSTSGQGESHTVGMLRLVRKLSGTQDGPGFVAPLSSAAQFLQLLWEGGVVASGGYFLNYMAGGQGLPPGIFDDRGVAQLRLLVVLASQGAATDPDRQLLPFNNVAVVGGSIPPGANVYIERADGTDLVVSAAVPPGVVGFCGSRTQPPADQPATGADQWRTRVLYSMLGYRTDDQGGFAQSNQALPVGPAVAPEAVQAFRQSTGVTTPWYYQQNIPAADMAPSRLPEAGFLPPPDQDPYRGIAKGAAITVSFSANDVYGNQLAPQQAIPDLGLPVGYTDDMIPLSSWPGTGASYDVIAGGGAGFSLFLAFQAGSVVPGNGMAPAQALVNVSTQILKYRQAWYQVMQSGMRQSLKTSLMKNPASADGSFSMDGARLRHYVQAVYTFLGAAADIAPFAVTVPPSPAVTSFTSLAAGYPVTVSALGKANAEIPLSRLFASVLIPETASFPQNGTLGAMAAKAGVSAGQLAALNPDILLSAGIGVITPSRTFTAAATPATLASIAAAASTTVNAVALANAAVGGILTKDMPVVVDQTILQVQQGESLNDLVTRFADQGVTTNVQTIATANSDMVGLIVPGATLGTTVRLAGLADSFATIAALETGWTVEQIGDHSAAVVNLVQPGLALWLPGSTAVTPGPADSFDSFTLVYARTLEQLVQANATTPLLPGATVLMEGMAVPAATGAVPFGLPANATWNAICASLGLGGDLAAQAAMMEDNRNIPDLLVAGVTITLGSATTTTTAGSTFASVLAALNAPSGSYDYADLVGAIATTPGLLAEGGTLAVPPPPIPDGLTLGAVCAQWGITPDAFAIANAATVGLIAGGASLTIDKNTILTVAGDTFATVVARYISTFKAMISVEDVAKAAIDAKGFLLPGGHALLPPALARMDVVFYATPPATPPYAGTVFDLSTTLCLTRPADCIHPDFADDAAVAGFAVPIPPVQEGDGASGLLLTPFATRFEAMFPDLKVAVGARQGDAGSSGNPHLYCVNFSSTGVSQVEFTTGQPAVYAIKPITNATLNLAGIGIKALNPDFTLGDATDKDFNSIDPDLWAAGALAAMDLMLSPEMTVPALALNSGAVTDILTAKSSLASTISLGLSPVLNGTDSSGIATARERLRQALLVGLSSGFAVDAALQYEAMVKASGDTAANLSGKAVPTLGGGNGQSPNLPGYEFTTGKTGLATGTSRIDFLLTVSQERLHKDLAIDLVYQINEFEYDIKDVPSGQGFKSSRWLSFVVPITPDSHPAAFNGVAFGKAQIPLALRAYPDLPVMRGQASLPGACPPAPYPDSLLQARDWSYEFQFDQLAAAQDDTFLSVLFNQGPAAVAPSDASVKLRALCANLAQFQAVYPALKTELLELLDPGKVAGDAARLTNAIGTFRDMVKSISDSWSAYWMPTGADMTLEDGLVASRFDVSVSPTVQDDGDLVFMRSLTLTALNGSGYGANQYPEIEYRTASGTEFISLVKSVTSATQASYGFADPLVPAYQSMSYRYRFDGLNAIAQQDAWAELVVKRNLSLVPFASTAEPFVYSTPPVAFSNPAYPALVRDQIIDVKTDSAETLAQAVASIFANLFQGGSGSYTIRVLARYGYTLAAPPGSPASQGLSDADIISEIPVSFYPNFTYSDAFQTQLVQDLTDWFNHHQPATDRGSWVFDITVFSSLDRAVQQPILRLCRLIFRMAG
jgi:LysM repeat protein